MKNFNLIEWLQTDSHGKQSATRVHHGTKSRELPGNPRPLRYHCATLALPLRYVAMIFAVLVMSMANIGTAWADQTVFSKNFNTMTSAAYSSTTDRVSTDGIKYYIKSGKHITITNGTGVIFDQNAGTGTSFHGLAIPLTGVRQSLKITMTVPYSSKSTWKYQFVGGETVSDTPPGTVDQSDKDASGTVTINISSLTNYTGVLYIGRAGSNYTTINNITVTTPNLVTHTLTNVTKSSGILLDVI